MNSKIVTIVGALILSAVFIASPAFAKDMGCYSMGPASGATSLIGKQVTWPAENTWKNQ